MEQCRATTPTTMTIDIDTSKPENLFIRKNGVEVPIESELNFAPLEEFPQKIQVKNDRFSNCTNSSITSAISSDS
jgi:hypothetical protein